jgi:glycosyltransferase involved in cell wall biosynthesis
MVTTFYPPHSFGGDGVFVRRLAHALARRGHEVEILYGQGAFEALGDGGRREAGPEPDGVSVRPLARAAGRLGLLLDHQLGRPVLENRALAAALRRGGFDVIHFHNISLAGGPGLLRHGEALKLCTLHDYWFVCPMHVLWRLDREPCSRRTCLRCTLAGRRPPQLWRRTGAVAGAARCVDAFLAPSELSRRLHGVHGFPAPIQCLPHFALPPPAGGPEVSERPYFLSVGRLEKLKGVQVLLKVFRSYRGADLVLAGTGGYEPELRRMAADLPHVRFLGWVGEERLARLYRGALAVVVPSLCFETFGLVPVEAFAARIPAVVPAGGALAEVVAGGGGLLYQDEDELAQLLAALQDRPEWRRGLGEAGYRNYLENYTEEIHLQRYFALIGELSRARARAGEGAA